MRAVKFTFGNLPSIGWVDPVARLVELAKLCEDEGLDRFGVSDWRSDGADTWRRNDHGDE